MRFLCKCVPVVILLFTVPARSQQATSLSTLPLPVKDVEAVMVVSQALAAAGGTAAIATIADYTANGNITYHMDVDRDVQGTVTIRGNGVDQLRLDANLPAGTRSESTSGSTSYKREDGTVEQLHRQSPMAPARLVLPYLELLMGSISTKSLSLLSKGQVQLDGHTVYDIQVQHVLPPELLDKLPYLTIDFFIDSSSFQVLMMQDMLSESMLRQVRYSNFSANSGVTVPLSISTQINGQPVWDVGLTEINFNRGLTNADFSLTDAN